MTSNISVRSAVRRALVVSAVSASVFMPAMAQAQSEEAATLKEVIVTGTRIVNRDAEADTPILTVSQEAMADSGYVTVEQYLNTLPQITPGLSSQSNNPSSNGRAFIDLRGLGSNRNLVLIDGRRGMGSTSGGVVDINTIPASLIDRVEVITGGAAAAYGPDAVAGVVNFIMKKNFDGVAVKGDYHLTEESDGQEWGADITMGGAFAGGNAVFNASYFKRDAIYKGARDFSAQASATTSIFPGGSWNPGANTPNQTAVNSIFGAGACASNGGQAGFGFNPDGTLFCTGVQGGALPLDVVGYTGPQSDIATRFYPDVFSYNFEPANILMLPMERWSLYTHFDKEVSSHFRPYMTAMFTNYSALQELAPTPAGGGTGFTIPVTNPFIPAQLSSLLSTRANPTAPFNFSKRFNALGGRTGYNNHDVWQLTMGGKGDIVGEWTYDLYYSYGKSVLDELQGGNVRLDRTQTLLNAANGGTTICSGGLNLFGAASISDACRAYISLEAKNLTVVEQNVVEGTVNGELFALPAGRVLTAIGASYRDLSFDFKPDSGLQPGLVAGFNQQLPINGKIDYTDVYAEVDVPILSEMALVKRLGITGGVRTTDSSVSGDDLTWKFTLDWTANDWARMRAGYQHAVRSPNIAELYSPQVNNFPTFTNQDPCNTTGTIANTYRNGPNGAQVQALCAAQSAVAGGATYVQPNGQAQALTGGEPTLQPESADSLTVGVVLQSPFESEWTKRLSLSIDYWSVEMEDVIASFGAATIVQRCFNRDGANPTYSINNSWCQFFQRDQSNGSVVNLIQLPRNQSFVNTSGIDVTVNWGFGLGNAGDLNFQAFATWINKYESQDRKESPVYDYAGTIGQTTASSAPSWRSTLVTTYSLSDLQVQFTSRYIDSMAHANTLTGGSPLSNTSVPRTWYFDLVAKYNLTEQVSVKLGVNNVGAQKPRMYTPNVQANTDPSLYDVLGRRYFAGFEAKL